MNKKSMTGNIMLLLAAFIWGTAFVAQRQGMDYLGPFTFNAVRNFIGSVVLIPIIFIFKKIQPPDKNKHTGSKKDIMVAGICCGCMLFLASSFQQIGIKYTSVGKAGFITTFYVIIIPILGLFIGKKIGIKIWISLVSAIIGLYLLCMSNGFEGISKGDFYILLCAFCNAFHILTVDKFSPKVNGVFLSCIQFFVCGVISSVPMLIFESPEVGNIIKSAMPLLYTGILSSGVAYTFQILGQARSKEPVIASLIMSLESVFSVLAGWVVLHEVLSSKELLGCIIVFGAVILAQLPEKRILLNKKTI